jgi:GNAT superfamily N-acetyltransferase
MNATLKAELSSAEELMNHVLRESASIAAEFPLVFREGFPGQVVSLGDAEAVRSACTILVRDLVAPRGALRVGFIGSVATDPEFRSQGLATQVLRAAESRLAAQGAIASLLWADDSRFYYARGYRPVGAEEDYAIDRDVAVLLPDHDRIREARPADADVIHALYGHHEARTLRTEAETAALLECPGMTTLVATDTDDVPVAYACMGRGADLPGTIHEHGGDTSAVLALVRRHAEARVDEPTFLIAPTSAAALHERMQVLGVPSARGVLGLAKIVDRGAAAAKLGELLGDTATVTFDPDATDSCQVHLRTERNEAHLNDDTLLVLLFSTRGEREDILRFGEHFGVPVDRLPLDPFVWGLDSI